MLPQAHLKQTILYFYSRGQQIAAFDPNVKGHSASINREASRREIIGVFFLSFCQEAFFPLFIHLFILIYDVIEM